MVTFLRREVAPISEAAWAELDAQAGQVIRRTLAGRKVVDLSGPHGWEFGAVNLGRIKLNDETKKKAAPVQWGVREVLPLAEIRVFFNLSQFEIDNLSRGAADADIDPLLDAAATAAKFEDQAIFQGLAKAGITGVLKAAASTPLKLGNDPAKYPQIVGQALKTMGLAGVGGPYAVVLGPDAYFNLMQATQPGYPPKRVITDMTEGEIVLCPVLDGGVVMSTRGGDFELTVGADFSIGYQRHEKDSVEFFLTESFTFRVIEPKAAVPLAL
ncbi:MAG: bacteriocin family protein [Sedimentisphaerales bacterium]|nr:bacteriocin family protein [Sedimentisphaerales bacterium]